MSTFPPSLSPSCFSPFSSSSISSQHAVLFVFLLCLSSEYLSVTHLRQVTDNMDMGKCINILKHHCHGCHDVNVSVETHLGIRVRVTSCHDHVTIHLVRTSENTLIIIIFCICLFVLITIVLRCS